MITGKAKIRKKLIFIIAKNKDNNMSLRMLLSALVIQDSYIFLATTVRNKYLQTFIICELRK